MGRIRRTLTGSLKKYLRARVIIRFLLVLISLTAAAVILLPARAAQVGKVVPGDLWQDVNEAAIIGRGRREIVPRSYRTLQLNRGALTRVLAAAPREFTPAASNNPALMSLPMPDGSFARFRIEESPIFEPALAAQFPQIKTYTGQGIDDPTATMRFDWTPAGFHAMVLSSGGTVYVDPYASKDVDNYISYYKRDHVRDGAQFICFVDEAGNTVRAQADGAAPDLASGQTLRVYRLAVAATTEYTDAAGGTVSDALARITTTVNRVDGIYERDLAVRFVLVANEANIIYTGHDPYSNKNGTAMLNQNQSNLDSEIGSANYDIGHVFSTGGGGVAVVGVVCNNASKAEGVTGSPNPVGDGFDVDYVAHEMGHQFGALHTFNGTTLNCGGGNRSASAAYEPGSGSTIMAYAGICGAQDLQPHSDAYFHSKSLSEIITFISGNSCPAQIATGNAPPQVSAGASFTIPKGTPFALTATASDANQDAVTYCWEEYDLGPASPPDTDADGQARPIFRSFDATTNPSRTFPKLSNILSNTSTIGEALPTLTRTMNFQVTARDNRAGGGGVATATTQVSVRADCGPFLVTQPNTAITWTGGTAQAVTWSVANTTAAPVSCASVKITLSTDGGNSFPITLAASTPNDGSETITVPDAPTSAARVKVEAAANIFFDISDASFQIVSGCVVTLGASSQSFAAAGGAGSVNVVSACNWTAVSNNPDFITITSGGSGSGNGTVGYSVAANATASIRSGTVTVGTQTFTVFQGIQFADVPETSPFYTEVGKLSARGVTLGCGGGNYCPDAPITREQMSAFILRALGEFNPPQPSSQRFADVTDSNPFYAYIDRMAVLNITQGCGNGNYCPSAVVSREQMAAFIIRGLGEFNPPQPSSQRFADVPDSNPFYAYIDRMAALNITLGCGNGNYCPNDQVTRAQMAAFLVRAFGL